MILASSGSLRRACAVVACLWAARTSQAGVQALESSCATVAGHSFKLVARQHPAQPVVLTSSDRVAFVDGTPRGDWLHGLSVVVNPADPAAKGRPSIAGVRLDTLEFAPVVIDLALPCDGPSWPVARSVRRGSAEPGSVHGPGWHHDAQPQASFEDVPGTDLDVVRLVLGGDRFAEFRRVLDHRGKATDVFRGVNGTAGAVVRSFTPVRLPGQAASSKVSIFTFCDPLGAEAVFFGPEADSRDCRGAWQLWKITDAAGAVASVGGIGAHADPRLALAQGYDALGRVMLATDSAGRSYGYSHAMIDGVHPRLVEVRVDAPNGQRLATVRYDYGTAAAGGRDVNPGDLHRVTVVTPVDGGEIARTTLYRTWTPAAILAARDMAPGPLHAIRMVVEPEGVRRAGTLVTADDATLAPYASLRLGYRGERVSRIEADGLTDRRIDLSLERRIMTPAATCYDPRWASRAIVRVVGRGLGPDVHLRTTTHLFDHAGQPLSTTIAAPDGPGGSLRTWVWPVVRDARGCVTLEGSPSSVATFDAASGTWTWGAGPVRVYERLDERASARWAGFVSRVARRVGPAGAVEPVLDLEYLADDARTLPRRTFAGGHSIARPLVSTLRTYPRGVAVDPRGLETRYEHHLTPDADAARASGLVLSWIGLTHPAVSTSEHGSGLSTRSAVAMRRDGRITHIRARGDDNGPLTVLEYATTATVPDGSMATGRVLRVHEDASGDEPGLAPPAGFLRGNVTPRLRTRTYTHDALGQLATVTGPEGRTTAMVRTRLADGREVAVAATQLPDGLWASPGALAVTTLDGATEFEGLIAFGPREPGWNQMATTSVHPRLWIDPASSEPARCLSAGLADGAIRKAKALEFDASGRRVVEARSYHRMPDPTLGDDAAGKEDLHFDVIRFGHDAFGRVATIMDPTRTIDRVEWDAFDRPRRAYRGVEGGELLLTTEWVYDGGRAGGDGLLTEVRRHASATQPPRVTRLRHDAHGRTIAMANPVPPHLAAAHDASGRPVVAAIYGGTPESFLSLIDAGASPGSPHASLKGTRIDRFDAMGQRFRREVIAGSGLPGSTPPTQTLATQWWYDPQGRVAMRHGASTRKFAYDDTCGCGTAASWTCVVPRLGGSGTYPYEHALSLQPDDVVLAMSLTARDPVSGLVRASASLRRAAGAFEGGCNAGRRYELFGLPGDGSVAVNLEAACGMLADVRLNTHDALGRATASLRLGDPRLAGAEVGSVMLVEPGMAMPPSLTGGVMRSVMSPHATRGEFASFNHLGEAFATENDRGDSTSTTLDDAGRVTSERTSLGGMTTGSGGSVCEVPSSPATTMPSSSDGLGDQTDYQYDRGRPTVICAGSVCDTPRDGEEGMLDAGESLRIEYPDTSTGPPEVICAGTVCDGDPMNDNTLPKRMIMPGSVVPGERTPRAGDVIDLRHNLLGEVTAHRDGGGVTAMVERDEGGRQRRTRYAIDQTPDATGLPPIDAGIAAVETILDDLGRVRARQHVAGDGRVVSRVDWEHDAWGKVIGTSTSPSMAGNGGPVRARMSDTLESSLGMRFHRSWVDGIATGDGAAWRGSRLEGVTMPGSLRGVADLTFGLDGRREPGLSGGLGSYTGAVGMIAFPDDGRSVGAGGVARPLAEYVNQGIAWPEEVGLPQAGYEREQFRGMGMAVIPAPDAGHSTGLNQFGEPTVDRWHEVCAGANCGPVTEDQANAPFDQRVADPPPTGVCACSIYTEDNYQPEESKREEIVCAGLLETTIGWDAGRARSTYAEPPNLRRIRQYSIQATNVASRRELRSEDQGRTFSEVEATRLRFTTANQVASIVTTRADGVTVARSPKYDARGHLRDEGCVTKADGTPGRIFQYDHEGRLVGVHTRAADGRADVPLARFSHDAAGRLASATYNRGFIGGTDAADSTLDDDVTDLYVQDPSWRIVAVVRREAGDPDDASVRAWVRERWVYHHAGDGEGGVVAVAAGDDSPATRFIDDDGDGDFETVQHFLCNRRGDVVAIVEPGVDAEPGRVVARVWYDDYGMPRMHGPLDVNQDGVSDLADLATFAERLARFGALAADPRTWRDAQRLRNQLDWDRDGAVLEQDGTAFAADLAPQVDERFDARETLGNLPLYAGAWWDAWLEVYHVRHRVLDPKEGRWLQRDPIGYAGGSNLYAYVGNQPGRYVDPLGLRWMMAGGGGAGQPAGDGGDREECRRDERWVEQPGWLSAYAQGWAANVFNFFGDAKTFNQGPGPRPAAPRGNGPNQGVNPLDELMHAVDVADRTGNVSIAALSTNRFTAKEFGEFTQDLATGMKAAEIAASMAFEPIDLAMALAAIAESPGEWTAWASALPFVPSAVRMLPSQATGRGVGQNLGREYDSGTLRTNLMRMGAKIPEGAVAHHVVGNSLLAQKKIHPILRRLGVDLNDAANGIMLDESFHKTLGTDAYREYVVNLLSDVTSTDQLYELLDDVKRELLRQQDMFRSTGAKAAWSSCNKGTQ